MNARESKQDRRPRPQLTLHREGDSRGMLADMTALVDGGTQKKAREASQGACRGHQALQKVASATNDQEEEEKIRTPYSRDQ